VDRKKEVKDLDERDCNNGKGTQASYGQDENDSGTGPDIGFKNISRIFIG
jgi:hypothetical protein